MRCRPSCAPLQAASSLALFTCVVVPPPSCRPGGVLDIAPLPRKPSLRMRALLASLGMTSPQYTLRWNAWGGARLLPFFRLLAADALAAGATATTPSSGATSQRFGRAGASSGGAAAASGDDSELRLLEHGGDAKK